MMMKNDWFEEARYGLFVHFGLYSKLARGEWVMNKEELSPDSLRQVAADFSPHGFDADAIADLAVKGGMRYLVFTTMHHDGFRLYDTELSDFCSTKTKAGRDFTAEIIAAARKRGLKIGLYHSLNNWFDEPDSVAAVEDAGSYEIFMERTFARIRELVTRYNPVDVLWYDGWWPFDAKGWRSEQMNAMVRSIQPGILFNGRNCLPGDFATPEQHVSTPQPWRPWEACVTLNDNWGFHAGDANWKSPNDIIKMLAKASQGRGNLLLNIGPDGEGRIPLPTIRIVEAVGGWLEAHQECIYGTDFWTLDPYVRGEHRGDWCPHGPFTVKGNILYLIATSPPAGNFALSGLNCEVREVTVVGGPDVKFRQTGARVEFEHDGALALKEGLPRVLRIGCDRPPAIYKTGGMRVPKSDHPRYDPVSADILW